MKPSEPAHFDRIGAHFLKNIYATAKGRIRLTILQRDLAPLLNNAPLRILDIGGGAGHMALWYASLGHHVTLADPSHTLLAEGQHTAQTLRLSPRMQFIHSDAAHLHEHIGDTRYALVCCHAVLEWVENGEALLADCAARLERGGHLSLMYYNRSALTYAQHVFGNFDYLDRDLRPYRKTAKLTPKHPRTPAQVEHWLTQLRLQPVRRSAIRCFYDYMKPNDRDRHSLEDITQRELALSTAPEYLGVARYIHELRRAND